MPGFPVDGHLCMCSYVCVFMCACIHVCMCSCVHMRVFMCTCVHVSCVHWASEARLSLMSLKYIYIHMAKFKGVNACPPPEATKNVNISVGVRNLGEKDFG